MTEPDQLQRRRHHELKQAFAVVDSSLGSYYAGATHMYRPIAGQLRILFCDREPLLERALPGIKISSIRPIELLPLPDAELFDGQDARMAMSHHPDHEYRLARMPFLITKYSNGLQVADLMSAKDDQTLPLTDWVDQRVTVFAGQLTIRDIIRSISDKGGGAHVDDVPNAALREMYATGPAGMGVHVLFTVAIARCAQRLGQHFAQYLELEDSAARIDDVVFNPDHPAVRSAAAVDDRLLADVREHYVMTFVKRIK